MEFNKYLRAIINDEINKTAILKRKKGVVVEISSDGMQAIVQINSPPDVNAKTISLDVSPNIALAVNSVVWVYYWKNIADGFILPVNMYGIGQYINKGKTSYITADFSGNSGIFADSGININADHYLSFVGNKNTINILKTNRGAHHTEIHGYNNVISSYGNVLYAFVYGRDNGVASDLSNNLTDINVLGSWNIISGGGSQITMIGNTNESLNAHNIYFFSNNANYNSNNTIANGAQYLIGSYPCINNLSMGTAANIAIAFGCNLQPPSGGNGMELMKNGDLTVRGTVNSNGGADYAEYEEWQDGNPNGEDRRGLFVTEVDNFIKLADSDDNAEDVLGIVSTTPTICGDSRAMEWKNKYIQDVFGAIIYQEVEIEDENGEKKKTLVPQLNPDFRADQVYRSRGMRNEFSAIAYVGKVVAVDDGSCEINGYCKPGCGGVATKSDTRTRFRVRERLDDTHVLVRIR